MTTKISDAQAIDAAINVMLTGAARIAALEAENAELADLLYTVAFGIRTDTRLRSDKPWEQLGATIAEALAKRSKP